jgi:hypothetical protein
MLLRNAKSTILEIEAWFRKHEPEFVARITEQQLHQMIVTIVEVKDVFLACKLVRRLAEVSPSEELVRLLLKDYNEHLLDELEASKLIKQRIGRRRPVHR